MSPLLQRNRFWPPALGSSTESEGQSPAFLHLPEEDNAQRASRLTHQDLRPRSPETVGSHLLPPQLVSPSGKSRMLSPSLEYPSLGKGNEDSVPEAVGI